MTNRAPDPLEAAKAAVLQSVCHEFRTPLTVLKGYTYAMRAGLLDSDDDGDREGLRADAGSAMEAAIDRLELLLEVLVATGETLSEPGPYSAEVIDLTELLDEIAAGLGHRHDVRRLRLPDRPGPAVVVNRLLARLALQSLFDNALRFAGLRDLVEVRCQADPDGRHVDVVVVDHGKGLAASLALEATETAAAPRRAANVTDEGQAMEPAGSEGLGLHLFSAQRVIRSLGGRIWIDLTPDGDVRIVTRIPSTPPAEAVDAVDLTEVGDRTRVDTTY